MGAGQYQMVQPQSDIIPRIVRLERTTTEVDQRVLALEEVSLHGGVAQTDAGVSEDIKKLRDIATKHTQRLNEIGEDTRKLTEKVNGRSTWARWIG